MGVHQWNIISGALLLYWTWRNLRRVAAPDELIHCSTAPLLHCCSAAGTEVSFPLILLQLFQQLLCFYNSVIYVVWTKYLCGGWKVEGEGGGEGGGEDGGEGGRWRWSDQLWVHLETSVMVLLHHFLFAIKSQIISTIWCWNHQSTRLILSAQQ